MNRKYLPWIIGAAALIAVYFLFFRKGTGLTSVTATSSGTMAAPGATPTSPITTVGAAPPMNAVVLPTSPALQQSNILS